MTILVINGPNLNLLGRRNPQQYGTKSFEQCWVELLRAFPEDELIYRQSNHEGDIIDWLQEFGFGKANAIVLNAGGYTHTSVAIRDAVEAIEAPVAEVHISDITQREPFRKISLLTDVCVYTIIGKGTDGYRIAIEQLKVGQPNNE